MHLSVFNFTGEAPDRIFFYWLLLSSRTWVYHVAVGFTNIHNVNVVDSYFNRNPEVSIRRKNQAYMKSKETLAQKERSKVTLWACTSILLELT